MKFIIFDVHKISSFYERPQYASSNIYGDEEKGHSSDVKMW